MKEFYEMLTLMLGKLSLSEQNEVLTELIRTIVLNRRQHESKLNDEGNELNQANRNLLSSLGEMADPTKREPDQFLKERK
jgi:hypothetical protein